MFQYPLRASTMEKYCAPFSLGSTSSMVGVQWCGRFMALFRSLGSKQSLRVPFDFVTQTSEFTQSVGSVTLAMIPCASRLLSSFIRGSQRASGTLLGGCTTGGTVGSKVMWNSPSKHPIPSKHLGYSRRSEDLSAGWSTAVETGDAAARAGLTNLYV